MASKPKLTPAQIDEEARRKAAILTRHIRTPRQIADNDAKSEPLLIKYGLTKMAGWALQYRGPSLNDMSPLEIERFCIRGKMAGWKWALENCEQTKWTVPDFTEIPEVGKSYPLFDYGDQGPVGHLRNLADIIWKGKIEWGKKHGQFVVQNHFLQRCMWDLVNRTPLCEDEVYYNMLCGPGSCGKTFAAALRMLLLFYCFPRDFMGKVCSSSKGAAESRVWAEVVQWHEASIYHEVPAYGGRFMMWNAPQRILFVEDPKETTGKNRIGNKDVRRGIELVALPRSAEGKGAVKQLKGMRQLIKIWTVDEATDVDPSAYDPEIAGNWLEAQVLSQIVYLANPNHDSSAFVEHYGPREGEFYDPDSPGWMTKHNGYVTNLNGLDTPNRDWRKLNDRKRGKNELSCPFPYITNLTGIERLELRAGGRDTCAFMSQAVGFLPSSDIADSVLTFPMLQAAGSILVPEWTGDGTYAISGNDPSFGGDDFITAMGEIGLAYVNIAGRREKRVVLNIISPLYKVPYAFDKDSATPEEAASKFVLDRCKQQGIAHLGAIASDNTGISRGFVHQFETMAKTSGMQGTMVHRVGWKEKVSERPEAPDDPTARKSCDAYYDSTAELVMAVRQYRHYIRGFTDTDLIDQFGKRKFHIAAGNKYRVQTKDEFVKGVASKGWAPYGESPGQMDAVCVMLDLARNCGLGTSELKHPSMTDHGGRIMVRRRAAMGMYGGTKSQTSGWTQIKTG